MTIHISVPRRILASGFLAALAAAPAVAVVAVSTQDASHTVAECAPGLTLDATTGACIAAPAPNNTPTAIPGNPNLPSVDGVPCTGANTGECIGLQESQGGAHTPIP
jgi:hypothetical protein